MMFITPKASWPASSNIPHVTHRALSDPLPKVRGALYRHILISLSLAFLYIICMYLSTCMCPST